jgi:hypothetical protein
MVMHLKAKGAQVFGFGSKQTPVPFVNACSKFLYLENLGEPDTAAPAPKGRRRRKSSGPSTTPEPAEPEVAMPATPERMDTAALRRDARLVTLLRNAVESATGDDGWSPLGSVATRIGNQASFDSRNYGYRKLIDLIEATQLFEFERRGTNYVLRDKRAARGNEN